MENNSQIAARLREVLLDGLWIANTNFKAQISSVNWQEAALSIHNLNSMAVLTFHMNYYLDGLLRAFDSGLLDISDKFSFDLPPINSESDWHQLMNTFLGNAERFVKRVEAMDEDHLNAPFIDEKYGTYRRNIEGVIEHSYYHLGQLAIIRKMIRN